MIWLATILVPFLLAFGALAPRGGIIARSALPALAALPAFLAGAGVMAAPAAELDQLLLGVSLGAEGVRKPFLVFAAILWGVAGWFGGGYLAGDSRRRRFDFFFLLAMTGNFGLIVARDVPSFYTFFVLMTFASYGLVIHTRTPESLRAGRIYLVMAIIGELLLVAALYLAVSEARSIEIAAIAPAVAEAESRNLILLLSLLGFGVKVGAIPLYFWLPLAHPVAPTPASAVLSGSMIKAGLLGWIQISPVGEAVLPGWGTMVMVMGLIAAFGAVAIGLFQTDPKTNLAYSSISQMGVVTVLFGIGLTAGQRWETVVAALAIYAWNHGLAKGALFLGTGVAAAVRGKSRWVLAGLTLPALAIAGAPFTGGALAKYAMKETVVFAPGIWGDALMWLLPLSALGTSLLLGRFLWLSWWRMGRDPHGSPNVLALPWVGLIAVAAAGGLAGNGYFGLDIPSPGLAPEALFDAAWPLLLAAALLWGATVRLRPDPALPPRVPPGDFVVLLERLVSGVRSGWRKIGLPDLTRGAINLTAIADRIIAGEAGMALVNRIEERMSAWKVAGAFFLFIALAFIVLLI